MTEDPPRDGLEPALPSIASKDRPRGGRDGLALISAVKQKGRQMHRPSRPVPCGPPAAGSLAERKTAPGSSRTWAGAHIRTHLRHRFEALRCPSSAAPARAFGFEVDCSPTPITAGVRPPFAASLVAGVVATAQPCAGKPTSRSRAPSASGPSAESQIPEGRTRPTSCTRPPRAIPPGAESAYRSQIMDPKRVHPRSGPLRRSRIGMCRTDLRPTTRRPCRKPRSRRCRPRVHP